MRGIYYNSQKATCSIYESGLMVYNCLKNSPFYTLDYTENRDFLQDYDFAIVNQHDVVNFWITETMVKNFNKPVFCVVTEVGHSGDVISRSPKFYTAYIVLDSSIDDINNIYGFPRPLEQYIAPTYIEKNIPIIGSFGFATGGKRWDKILEQVYKEFDNAIVRFNIPYATYIPDNKSYIDNVINKCNEVVSSNNNPNIKLEITHTNFIKEELIYWCSQNTINCFFYDRNKSHPTGLCATADQCIIAERPLLVTGDNTFRHIHKYIDYFPNISIKESIEQTIPGVLKMKEDWSSQNFTEKFENILVHYVNKYNQNKIKNNKPVIFGFEVSAYYYVHNFYQDANVTHILLNLFEEFKQTGKNAFDVNNQIFGDTISGHLKYLYINLKKKDYSIELKQQEGVTISWNNIISFIEGHLTSEKSPPENLIEVSIGEIIDKYSILELKMRYISDEKKREDIKKEISVLEKHIGLAKKSHFYKILLYINDLIWKNTDKIKALSGSGSENDPNTFANISNEIFVDNQKRFRIKNYFNNKFSSDIKEHKSYSQYGCYIKLDEKIIYEKIPEINYLFVSYDCLYVDSTYQSIIKKMFPNYNFNFIDLENANKDLMKTTVDICVYSISDKSIRPIFDFLPIKYKSGGKMGDYLNQLSVICEKYYETGRKGELYIYNLPNQGDHFGFGLDYAHKDTYNIIMSQKYISDYKIYNGEDVDIDLSSWRNNLKKIEKLYPNFNWNIIYNKEYKIEWGKHQWIYAEINDTWKDRIIINNPYYRHLSQNAINQIRQLILQNKNKCIFISNEVDHYNSFIHNIGIRVEYYKPIDFEETCIIINSCKYGIFGFSAFAVIANGLHKSHYLIGNNWDDSYLVNRMKGFMPNILDIFV